MGLTIGTRLGAYEILSLLGSGGMGEVYRARDTKLDRDVAIKVLPELFVADPERVARFQREAKTLAALNHPHIGGIYGLEDADGVRALVLELVEGPTLAERIGRGAVPLDEALLIAKQIAEALEAAHERDIIHRDLKPANVKLRSDGMVKVLDFGLAKSFERTPLPSDLTQLPVVLAPAPTLAGAILGTAAYMSPEQAAGRPVDQRGDLWAFGVVLFEMLTGRQAFTGDTPTETVAAVIMKEPDWTRLPEATPEAIRRLLRRCLEKDRKRRLSDAAAARLEIEDALAAPSTEPSAARTLLQPYSRWPSALALGAALAVGGTIVAAAMLSLRRAPDAPVTRLEITTPPTPTPFAFQFALSPNGRQLAFAAGTDTQIWVRPLDQVNARPLAGTDGAAFPFWSPDGQSLGFFAGGKLKRIDLAGGARQVLADAPGGGATWNADGTIVFGPGPGQPLMRVPAAGGDAVVVTHLTERQGGHAFPQFLPDERHFLFFAPVLGPPRAEGTILLASLDGGEPTAVTTSTSAAAYVPGYLLRVLQGILVAQQFEATRGTLAGDPIPVASDVAEWAFPHAFSVSGHVLAYRTGSGTGKRQLVWLDRTGKVIGTVGEPDEAAPTSFTLAPDGQRVANARTVQGNYDIWLTDVGRSVTTRFTFDPAAEFSPVWSPDSTQVVFRSANRNGFGTSDLFVKPANGATDEHPLLLTPQAKNPLDWSRDGRFLLFASLDPKTQSDLWVLPLNANAKPFPIVQTSFDETQGQFSPDGHWLAYTSNESGRDEVYVRPFPDPGGKWQVSAGGGSQPRWRPNGKEVFYIAPNAKLMAASVVAAPNDRVVTIGAPAALFSTHLAAAGIGPRGYQSRAQYAVASDGRFLMNVVVEQDNSAPITIVQNWDAVLKK